MRAVGVIPSRWGSTRLPGKSLVPLCGKPLVQRVYERACAAKSLDAVLVATDDARIVAAVSSFGGDAVLTRADHPSGTDRIAEAVEGLEADLVVNIQGDEPLLDPGLIDQLVERMQQEPNWDMGTAVSPLRDKAELANPSVVKAVFGASGRALYFSRSLIPFNRDGDDIDWAAERPHYWRHIGLYVYRRAFLARLVAEPPCTIEMAEKLEQLRALYIGGQMVVVESDAVAVGVDTPADVLRVEALIREQEQYG